MTRRIPPLRRHGRILFLLVAASGSPLSGQGAGAGAAAGQEEGAARTLERALAQEAQEREDELSSNLELRSSDGRLQVRFYGKVQNDWAFFSADRDVEEITGPFQDGTELRRARLGIKGSYEDWFKFKLSYDFGDGVAGVRDAYFEPREVPVVGSLRIGHFKEPVGLEARTSSSYLTFLERSVASALTPGRNVGLMAFDAVAHKRVTWAVGVFRATDSDAFGADEGGGKEFAATGRLTWLPWYGEKGRRLLHLGGSLSLRNPDQGRERFRARPEADLAPRIVDTGRFPADREWLAGLETALVLGPASVQAEYLQADVRVPEGGWQRMQGYYVQASLFLTGEYRPYSRNKGVFSRVQPMNSVGEGGLGALELAGRYSRLDLQDRVVFGGAVQNLTLGVSWYLTPRFHLQLNYVVSDLETYGNARIVEARIHFDW